MSRQRTARSGTALGCVMLAGVLACASGPSEPAKDPFLVEIEAAEKAIERGQTDVAQARLDAAAARAAGRGRQSLEQARLQLDLARLHRLTGERRQARHHLGLARFATRVANGENSLEMAALEFESSLQQQAAGSHAQSVESLREALRIRRRLLTPDDPEIARTLTALGFAHQRAFDYAQAAKIIRHALDTLGRWPVSAERTRLTLVNRNRLVWIYEGAALSELADEQRTLTRAMGSSDAGLGDIPKMELGLAGLPNQTSWTHRQIQELAGFAREWISMRRIAEEHFSIEALMLANRRRLDRGTSPANARSALTMDLQSASIAFAPVGARSTSGGRYLLPFESAMARRVSTDHLVHAYQKVYLHAVDFEMPPGSAVRAARGGVIARAITGFARLPRASARATADPPHGEGVNRVTILHEDGTYASYFPLAPGMRVWEGMSVVAGEQLGEAAATNSGPPLLHFDVRRNVESRGRLAARPVRISFEGVGGANGIPLVGQFYGGKKVPKPASRDYRVH